MREKKSDRKSVQWGWGLEDYIFLCVSFDSRLCRPDRRDHITVWWNRKRENVERKRKRREAGSGRRNEEAEEK